MLSCFLLFTLTVSVPPDKYIRQHVNCHVSPCNGCRLPLQIVSWFVNINSLIDYEQIRLTLDTSRSCFISLGISVPRTAIQTWTMIAGSGQFWQRCNSPFTLFVWAGGSAGKHTAVVSSAAPSSCVLTRKQPCCQGSLGRGQTFLLEPWFHPYK